MGILLLSACFPHCFHTAVIFFHFLWVPKFKKAVQCIYFSALPLGSLPEQSCYCSSLNAEAAVWRWSLRIFHEENRVRSYLFLSSRVKEKKKC